MIFYIVAGNLQRVSRASHLYGDKVKKPPLYGMYKVITFIKNRDTLPPLTTDTTRWNKLMVSFVSEASVKLMNDSLKHLSFTADTAKHTVTIGIYDDTLHRYAFNYRLKKDTLLLMGKWNQDSIYITMRRFGRQSFPLINRGFHMINEYPFNR